MDASSSTAKVTAWPLLVLALERPGERGVEPQPVGHVAAVEIGDLESERKLGQAQASR
jgi:hypothetical protein